MPMSERYGGWKQKEVHVCFAPSTPTIFSGTVGIHAWRTIKRYWILTICLKQAYQIHVLVYQTVRYILAEAGSGLRIYGKKNARIKKHLIIKSKKYGMDFKEAHDERSIDF